MSTLLSAVVVCCLIIITILCGVGVVVILSRLHSIDEGIQKTALLLTVLANLQGTTDGDIQKALGGEGDAETAESAEDKEAEATPVTKNSKKKK